MEKESIDALEAQNLLTLSFFIIEDDIEITLPFRLIYLLKD